MTYQAKAHITLRPDHPAIVEGRTLRPNLRRDPSTSKAPVLKSGEDNRKLGGWIIKGEWAGHPIYALTLEERATCWVGCKHYRDCYGNSMQWGHRFAHGPDLEARIALELPLLAQRHPHGFAIRLHVLGDFYSSAYVRFWADQLVKYPMLKIFGFTGWPPLSEIGLVIDALRELRPKQFRVRFSDYETHTLDHPARGMTTTGVVCPVQTGDADNCGSCALCWQAPNTTTINFMRH